MLLLAPSLAFAEVSDKEPTIGLIWAVGAFSALLCFMVARLRRWLAPIVGALPLLWFVSLLMEIHASDVAPYLYAEQGLGYYVQSYLSLGLLIGGMGAGCWVGRPERG